MQEVWVPSLVWDNPLEKEMATHSSNLAWEIPWTEEPGRLQSMGLQSRTRLGDFTYSLKLEGVGSINVTSDRVKGGRSNHCFSPCTDTFQVLCYNTV